MIRCSRVPCRQDSRPRGTPWNDPESPPKLTAVRLDPWAVVLRRCEMPHQFEETVAPEHPLARRVVEYQNPVGGEDNDLSREERDGRILRELGVSFDAQRDPA